MKLQIYNSKVTQDLKLIINCKVCHTRKEIKGRKKYKKKFSAEWLNV